MIDDTKTHCPYCGEPRIGQSRYVYRVVKIGGISPYDKPLPAVEIYCANCQKTLSITPISSGQGK